MNSLLKLLFKRQADFWVWVIRVTGLIGTYKLYVTGYPN